MDLSNGKLSGFQQQHFTGAACAACVYGDPEDSSRKADRCFRTVRACLFNLHGIWCTARSEGQRSLHKSVHVAFRFCLCVSDNPDGKRTVECDGEETAISSGWAAFERFPEDS